MLGRRKASQDTIMACVIVLGPKLPISHHLASEHDELFVSSYMQYRNIRIELPGWQYYYSSYTIMSHVVSLKGNLLNSRSFRLYHWSPPTITPRVHTLSLSFFSIYFIFFPSSLSSLLASDYIRFSNPIQTYSTLILPFQFHCSETYPSAKPQLHFKMQFFHNYFLNMLLLPLLLPSLVLSSPHPSAVPTKPTHAHHSRKFTLKSHVLSPPNPAFENLDLEPYHIYPAFNYAVFVSGQKGITGYLNGTRQEFADKTVSTCSKGTGK